MTRRNALAGLVFFLTYTVCMVWAADYAEAATYNFEDFAVPNPNRPPTVRDLLVIDTSELAGQTCSVVVDTLNGQSVHPENYITVEGGVPTITVTGSEDGVNGEHQSASTVVMGDSLVIRNHFQLSTSVEGDVTITCDTTTTTTTPTSTTTSSPTSSTSTSVPVTTTTSNTGSTVPPATTTTVPSSTTTTSPNETTTTEPPGSSTVPPVSTPDPTLPFTGPEDMGGWAMAAGALILLGSALVVGLREGEA